MSLQYEHLTSADVDACLALAMQLWPDEERADIQKELVRVVHSKDDVLVGCKADGQLIGFAHVGLRHDYVEGSTTSPVAYLEGIFVLPEFRKQGIAKQLVDQACAWGRVKGCTEIGSDALLENTASHAFHQSVGFQEAERLVTFVKKL